MRLLTPRTASMADQGLISGSNLMAFLVAARCLPTEDWGSFGFAFASVTFLQGFQRSSVIIPMIMSSGSPGAWEAQRTAWRGLNTMLLLACATCFAVAAALAGGLGVGWLAKSMTMATVICPALFVFEFARRSVIQESRFLLLIGVSASYALCVVAGAAAMTATQSPSVWLSAAAMTAGALVGTAVHSMRVRRSPISRPKRLRDLPVRPAFVGWSSLSHVAYSGYNYGIQFALGALAGPAALGIFHACRILVQPVMTLAAAMDGIDKPRASRAYNAEGMAGLRASMRRAVLTSAAIALPYLFGVAAFAEPLATIVLGDQYADSASVAWMWCIAALGVLIAQPVDTGLYVTDRPRALFLGRVVATVCALAVCWYLVPGWGAVGAVAATATGFLVTIGTGLVTFRSRLKIG